MKILSLHNNSDVPTDIYQCDICKMLSEDRVMIEFCERSQKVCAHDHGYDYQLGEHGEGKTWYCAINKICHDCGKVLDYGRLDTIENEPVFLEAVYHLIKEYSND